MIRKYMLGVLAIVLALTLFSSAALAAAPEVVVTSSGLALLMGETVVKPGSTVLIEVVPKGETPLTAGGRINGYVNETVVQRDGKYKLLFSLEDIYTSGTEYECHIDLASQEYYLVPIIEGSLIEIDSKKFDRDTKTITITGSLWDSSMFGTNLTLTLAGFEKRVKTSEDGKFCFEFTADEAGITEYGEYDFTIAYADDSSSYCEDSIEIVTAGPILENIKKEAKNSKGLEEILTNPENLRILGFDSSVLYGDCDLSELAGTGFFAKLAKTNLKADKVSQLEQSIKEAYALYNMEKNPSDKNLRRCIALFELEPEDAITRIYDNFNQDTEPQYLFGLWKDMNFTKVSDASAFYKDAVLRTKLNAAGAWSDLMLFANENHTLLGVEKQTSADFWQKLIAKAPFTSLSDFKTKYNNVLKSQDEKPSGGSGGGSTGGSMGFGTAGGVGPNPTPTGEPQNNQTVFRDVESDHWAAEAITKLYEMGIVNGKSEGIFAPNDLVTRAEVAKLMCVSAKIEKVEVTDGIFSDVDGTHWAIGYIEAAYKSGFVNGRGNGNFAPNDYTTREDMAVFCYRLYRILHPNYSDTVYAKEDLTFADANEIADYAAEPVAAMTKLGILSGKGDNRFDPKAFCTRAEAAKIFYGVLR